MKFGWIMSSSSDIEERKDTVKDSLESSIPAIIVKKDEISTVRELGSIEIISDSLDADIVLVTKKDDLDILKSAKDSGKKTCVYITIETKEDEIYATKVSRLDFVDYIILEGKDWTIIPLENIIADLFNEDIKIVSLVNNVNDAKAAYEILEKGVDGVVLVPKDINEVKEFSKLIDSMNFENVALDYAVIKKIEPVGSGDRVCIDTCSIMEIGEGMLIGSYSRGMFLVHSESVENPYVATRPFRVNAGPVHAYILCPENKTKYLSDLKAGDKVLIVNKDGKTRETVIGRIKIEKRPLFLVEAEYNGEILRTILQNAETIRLVSDEGKPISVVDLKEGLKVLIKPDENARHFGMAINESIIEK
ncbi:3-dehydroquinate synthase [Methanococcus vannielii SB]|jgi:3-dehydroquinate synthase II|uniref:3-dehydroquinate synthase n=1 Tax=Methanococcus vannielii (strain ATCC 35089 / DSM 1224 / JCM 13029 / OCM 148 / SB) TaxID=406327 RepID=DHQS_METVS|nr:3-dehydroquinate synthase II [Methanococcus vannielii]A6URJ1.1 RecName: Full=3-dehydroquinate synthase; Short=DHQ synthase; AltName: Full=3-dehydroquinate synthase II [Methanococcus vannielii SB]ABR55113.1 3-dehydroquinate synthase [Methanococcus vannielii SB]